MVTFCGFGGLPDTATGILRADQVFFRGVRLPYIKFRNPHSHCCRTDPILAWKETSLDVLANPCGS